jgi:hypothetical protein
MEKQFPPDSVTHRSGQWSTFAGSKNAYILIEPVRKNVLAYWQEYTLCERKAGDDIITDRFECIWQCGHEPPEIESSDHFSIFCSMGEWNTMVMDFLEDNRYDQLDLSGPEAHPQLFRHYTLLFLLISGYFGIAAGAIFW